MQRKIKYSTNSKIKSHVWRNVIKTTIMSAKSVMHSSSTIKLSSKS